MTAVVTVLIAQFEDNFEAALGSSNPGYPLGLLGILVTLDKTGFAGISMHVIEG